jgi:hypothetical protein
VAAHPKRQPKRHNVATHSAFTLQAKQISAKHARD